jgi:hypothetical protein
VPTLIGRSPADACVGERRVPHPRPEIPEADRPTLGCREDERPTIERPHHRGQHVERSLGRGNGSRCPRHRAPRVRYRPARRERSTHTPDRLRLVAVSYGPSPEQAAHLVDDCSAMRARTAQMRPRREGVAPGDGRPAARHSQGRTVVYRVTRLVARERTRDWRTLALLGHRLSEFRRFTWRLFVQCHCVVLLVRLKPGNPGRDARP